MHKDIFIAVVWNNESESLSCIEPVRYNGKGAIFVRRATYVWKLVRFDVTRETYHLTVPVMRSSLMERLVIIWRGWVCGANPAATARVDSRTASFMVGTSVEIMYGIKMMSLI